MKVFTLQNGPAGILSFLTLMGRVSLAVLLATASFQLHAHDPGLSALALRLDGSTLTATFSLAQADAESLTILDVNHDGRVTTEEFAKARPTLELLALDALEVNAPATNLEPTTATARLDSGDALHLEIVYPFAGATPLRVRSTLLSSLPRGHRQYAVLRDGRDKVLRDQMLDVNNAVIEMPVSLTAPAAAPTSAFTRFLLLGVEHIATGYDHLVFLLGLLVVGGTFRSVVKIVTSFTVAHSISLALATLDVIRFPASVVEPIIAASIIYVGIENLVRRDLDRRWRLAFAFGLIHGCGFASVLRELGIGANGSGVVMPLLSFNLGVELGQITLAAIVLPVIWQLKRRPAFEPRYVPACSVLITLAGGYWLAERILPALSR